MGCEVANHRHSAKRVNSLALVSFRFAVDSADWIRRSSDPLARVASEPDLSFSATEDLFATLNMPFLSYKTIIIVPKALAINPLKARLVLRTPAPLVPSSETGALVLASSHWPAVTVTGRKQGR